MSNNTKDSIYIDTRYDSLVKVYEGYLLAEETVLKMQYKMFFEQVKKQVVDYARTIGLKDVEVEIACSKDADGNVEYNYAALLVKQDGKTFSLMVGPSSHIVLNPYNLIIIGDDEGEIEISKEGIKYNE